MNIQSFCLKTENNQFNPTEKDSKLENLQVNQINNSYHNIILSSKDMSSIANTRGNILKSKMVKSVLSIESFNSDALFHTEIKASLVQLTKEFEISIKMKITPKPEIQLIGSVDTIEVVRTQILVLLDRLSGLYVHVLEDIPYHIHYLVAGRKYVQLHSIMEETCTSIYLQSPFNQIYSKKTSNAIYLTGNSEANITRAKQLLTKLMSQKIKSMYHKDSTIDINKLDWILINKRDEIKDIMKNNGSFFQFPILGSGSSKVTIYAENRIYVERSIRLLNHLTTSVYEASFKLSAQNHKAMTVNLSQISHKSGIDIRYNSELRRLHLFGTEQQIKSAFELLSSTQLFKEGRPLTKFAIELATDQTEFVSGKKNGKINKIMKTCGVTIRFIQSNEYNSFIVLESNQPNKAYEGLLMLQDELPAESSFYVPETYHRRIIGVGGRTIQKVMKKYGVYVKFSGAEEFTTLGGYFENEHNVVARTPMKNKANLDQLQFAVTDFIGVSKDKDFMTRTVRVPFGLHRVIVHQYGSKLRELCKANNTKVWWPERIGSDQVVIYGPESHLDVTAEYLERLVADELLVAVAVREPEMEEALMNPVWFESLKGQVRSHCGKVELSRVGVLDLEGQVDWTLDRPCSKAVLFKFISPHGLLDNPHKARQLLKFHIESLKFKFEELGPKDTDDKALVKTDMNISEDFLFEIFDGIPSPPLSENNDLPIHPLDVMSTILIPGMKNIWSTSQMDQSLPVQIRRSRLDSYFVNQTPPSPPMKNAFDPFDGSRSKSWPSVLFGGRDLFDHLPSRRAFS